MPLIPYITYAFKTECIDCIQFEVKHLDEVYHSFREV